MQETWKFDISSFFGEKTPEYLIRDVLLENQKDMGIFLSYYYKREGAVTENVQIIGSINFMEMNQGDFLVEFELIHFNACLNIHEQNKEKMKIEFEIARDLKHLVLTGPYWPEREMDEI